MAAFDRNKGVPGTKANWWVSYAVTEEMRVRYGLKTRTVREPGGSSQRAANALLAQRRREIREGTWAPHSAPGVNATLAGYAASWCAGRRAMGVVSAHDEEQRLRDHVLPWLGERRLSEVRRQDVRALVQRFATTVSERTGKLPAPRMVHRVYEDLRTLYAHAIVDEIVPTTPCTLKVARGELPPKEDADPRWRSGAVYSRHEVETLLSDEEIPLPRRVTYALTFLTGSRIGEVVGLHWEDYDGTVQPLGRLVIATQYAGKRTKTRKVREVPVHPLLAKLIATWKAEGFALFMGRMPRPTDYLVPKWRGHGEITPELHQDSRRVWQHLQDDLVRHRFRRRRVHDARRTLITLARADGATPDWLHWITHGPSASMMDLYSSPPWATLCAQISCLKIELKPAGGATVHAIRPAGSLHSSLHSGDEK